MKKLFTFIIAFFSLTVAMADKTNGFVEVSTAAKLKETIQKDPYAKIHLAADINLGQIDTGESMRDFFEGTFYGTIDGLNRVFSQGKEIFVTARLYGTKRDKRETLNSCLFNKLENAVFTNLTILNIEVKDYAYDENGLLAREAKNCVFSNVTMCNVSVISHNDNAGALIGRAEGCRFFAVSVQNSEVWADDMCAGGLVAYSKNCGYQLCATNPGTSVFAEGPESSDGAYAGGLVGHSVNDVFTHCLSAAMVGANDHYVGGLVGKSEYSQFISCQNCGPATQYRDDLFKRYASDHYPTVTLNSEKTVLPIVHSCIGSTQTICGHTVTAEAISSVVSELCRESYNNFLASISSGLLGKLNMMDLGPASTNAAGKALA